MGYANDSLFMQTVAKRVVVLDGGMGTGVMQFNLTLDDFDGQENCTDILTVTRPDVIRKIHASFLEVGCDAIETNTFGDNKIVLAEFDMPERTHELNKKSAELAREVCEEFSTPDKPRFAIGSIGPGTKLATLRQTTFDTLLDSYAEQVRGLIDGGVDVLLIETCQDILQIKACLNACLDVRQQRGREDIPIMVQVTIEAPPMGTMLIGTDIAAAVATVEQFDEVDVLGVNCATGPTELADSVKYLGDTSTRYVSVLPNAGLPQLRNGEQYYPLSPEELGRWQAQFVTDDGVNIVGGCCGTTTEHLAEVVKQCAHLTPRERPQLGGLPKAAVTSIIQAADLRQDNSFLLIGERCNTNGSRKFKRLLTEGAIDEMVEIAMAQVNDGSHVLDVCIDYVGRDGAPDMELVASRFAQEIPVPLMLDSTQVDVLETGLKLCGGKCIINSMNLEDGEEKLATICRLAKRYGAAVVALTIDEDPEEAMGKTADRKVEIARRIYDLAVNKYGLRGQDIMWDCLTFPITTGNESDRALGFETLDGIERIMKEMPECQSVLGLSNISFGLKPMARKVLNSVYLHHARERGLTAAIVHASGILPMHKIDEEARLVAEDLIYDRRGVKGESQHAKDQGDDYDPLLVLSTLFEGVQEDAKEALEDLPIDERLKKRIIDGNKVNVEKDLDAAMEEGFAPLQIINEFLLGGMKIVGELFGAGKMQLPFVLKSAECMKKCVAHLEQFMEKIEGEDKGRIVLATVKGDVHDIGKNLVDIILTNNGYKVFNIGIKQPLQNIMDEYAKSNAHAIGLSGLLVKSTIVMKENLEELNNVGNTPPILLGGAALTRKYVEHDLRKLYKGPVYYCKDAFEGLSTMDDIMTGKAPPVVAGREDADVEQVVTAGEATAKAMEAASNATVQAADRAVMAMIADENTTDEQLEAAVAEQAVGASATSVTGVGMPAVVIEQKPEHQSDIDRTVPIPTPPFLGSQIIDGIPLRSVLGMMNEVMLFQVQWGHKKARRNTADFRKYLDAEVRPHYRRIVELCEKDNILQPQAVYGYWPCNAEGNDLVIYDPTTARIEDVPDDPSLCSGGAYAKPNCCGGVSWDADTQVAARRRIVLDEQREIGRFTFPRQRKRPWWCLSDFFRPLESGEVDVVALQAVTVGQHASDVAREWFADNRYEDYLYLHGLGVESAEALAEFVHRQIRMDLGIAGRDARKLQDIFKQSYQGSRYSFGYPACPNLEDQTLLMKLLDAERIGLELSEEFQLHPEQSTTALICHHPAARYFNVR